MASAVLLTAPTQYGKPQALACGLGLPRPASGGKPKPNGRRWDIACRQGRTVVLISRAQWGARGAAAAGPPGHAEQPAVRHPAVRSALPVSRSHRARCRFRRRPALGAGAKRLPPPGASEWHKTPAIPVIFASRGTLFHLLPRDAARPCPVAVAGGQAVPDRRAGSCRAAAHRQFHHPLEGALGKAGLLSAKR